MRKKKEGQATLPQRRKRQQSEETGNNGDSTPKRVRRASPVAEEVPQQLSTEKVVDDKSRGPCPVILFAHGAGAGSSSDWMVRWKSLLESHTGAAKVVSFDYSYLAGKAGRRATPPRAERLVNEHVAQLQNARSSFPGHPIVLCGKSMGSRVGCMVAGDEKWANDVVAVVCLGYPLRGINGKIRDETLLELKVPVLFVQGEKDNLCPLEKLKDVRAQMTAESELYVVDGGDHSLMASARVRREKGIDQDQVDKMASQTIGKFLQRVISRSEGGSDSVSTHQSLPT